MRHVLKNACLCLSLWVVTGCADSVGHDPGPSTSQVEQGLQECDYEYYGADGSLIGWCIVPCGGPAQCSGTTRGPLVTRTEFSCATCTP